jgi:O-antigen/teichoic acid export membrane protein
VGTLFFKREEAKHLKKTKRAHFETGRKEIRHMRELVKSLDTAVSRQPTGGNHFAQVLFALAGDSAQYLIGLAVMGLANMVLLPLYTRYLSPSDFGVYALAEVLALGLISVSSLGFTVSYLKWFADVQTQETPVLLGTMIWVNGVVGLVAGAGLWLFTASAAGRDTLGGEAKQFAWMLLPLILFEVLQNAFLTHLRARRRAMAFSLASVIRLVSMSVLSIWFVAGRGAGLEGVFLGRVLGDFFGLLVLWLLSAPDISLSASLPFARAMTRYGLPVMGSSLIIMILDGSGRFFLKHYGSLEDVGLYAVGIKISSVMRMLIVIPFSGAWGGMLFQIAKKSDAKLIYSKIMSYVLVLSIAIALVFSVFSPLLLTLLATKEFARSLLVIPWLLLVHAAVVLQYPASVGIYIGAATKWLLPIFTAGILVSMILNRVLVPRYGMLGAAWAWLSAWTVITGLMGHLGQRYYALDYEWKPLLFSVALCAGVLITTHAGFLTGGGAGLLSQTLASAAIVLCVCLYLWSDLRNLRGRDAFSMRGLTGSP